ncbi:MAG TPA: universal stress protein [Streptosporangiaceae bacterium]|nr:universal stress protein [Streptosporangiaceae bacterium]
MTTASQTQQEPIRSTIPARLDRLRWSPFHTRLVLGLGDQAAQTQLRVSEGLAGRVIVETAHQTHAQLVVLAARTGMAVVPGTVSQYVLLRSRCPVAIVPHDDKDEHTDDNHS